MTTSTLTLTDFLLTRIAEDERHAGKLAETDRRPILSLAITVDHPSRVLAECEAKRRIVGLNYFNDPGDDWSGGAEAARDDVLRLLALPYADHPDYDESWRP